jgi:NADP-dependent 3-hydroxy acid dehydrogenase YdfG
MNKLFNLEKKVAVVSGGYGHLGTSMTKVLLNFGVKVYVAGRSKDKFNKTFNNAQNPNLMFIELDIMSSKSFEKCFKEIINVEGRIDILINNAHSGRGNSQEKMNDDDFLYTLDGVLGSVHKSIKAALHEETEFW